MGDGYLPLHAGEENKTTKQDCEPISRNRLRSYGSTLIGLISGILLSLFIQPLLSQQNCTHKMSTWSPALSIFKDQDISTQRFDGGLRRANQFRGPPSQDIDDAWDSLLYHEGGLFRLSRDQLSRINASKFAAKYPEEMGGGYIAGIEAIHQLHCVNMLRKATYMDYYLPRIKEWEQDLENLRYHLDHCIDMLRQKVMCDSDVGVTTYVWVKGHTQVFPDFNTVHKCHLYSKVIDWARENSVHSMNVSDIKQVPGSPERDNRP